MTVTVTRLPEFFQAPAEPIVGAPIRIDETTTARQLTVRTLLGAKSRTVPAAILMIGHQIGEALVPVVMGLAIDRAIATRNGAELVLWLGVLAVVFTVLSFSFRFGTRLGLLGMQTVAHQLRTRVTDRILDPKGMSGPARLPGVSLSIATSDVQRLSMSVAIGVYPVGEIAAVLFCGVVLMTTSWQLGVAILVGAPTILWILDRAGGPLREKSEREQELAAQAAGTATDLVTGFRVVKGLGAEAEASRRYLTVSRRALKGVLRATRSEGVYLGAMELVSGLFIVAVAVAAASMAVGGALSVGQLITVVGLTLYVMGPLGALASNAGTIWAGSLASAQRVLDVLQAPPAIPAGDDHAAAGRVSFDGFGSGAVADLDLELSTDALTVVIADAETAEALTSVLARAQAPEHGRVRVGETDLFELTHERATSAIRVAPHHSHLFEGSILENIAAGDASDSRERVTRAVFASACDDVVESLSAGLDTQVGEAGRLLSGGQRQRVALARALASNSDLLVLVEPTTAVDSVTESLIAERLAASRAGRATLIFTRSPALLAVATEVIVFDRGVLVYRGDPDRAPLDSSANTEANA